MPNFEVYLYSLSLIEGVFFNVLINQSFLKSQSLNLLLQSCSRLISVIKECQYSHENGENSLHEEVHV